MKKFRVFLPTIMLLSACNDIPRESFFNRGDPESLLDVSSEVVTVQLASDRSVDEVVDWVDRDQPTRAELLCTESAPACTAAKEVMGLYGIEYTVVPSEENAAHLIYERVSTRDCEHRYIDNHINPYNMSHPAYGCATASNMVRMVSDKRQFVNPALLDYLDGEKGVGIYEGMYLNPKDDASDKEDLTTKEVQQSQ